MAAAAVIAVSVAGCGGNSTQKSTSGTPGAAPAPVKVALSYQPAGTVALNWDPQSQNVTAKLQMSGFTPGSSHAMHVHQHGCGDPGDTRSNAGNPPPKRSFPA